MNTSTPTHTATTDVLADVLAELPGVKSNGRGGYDFPCTQEHKKRQRAGWVAVLGDKVRIGCYNEDGHGDELWRQHVLPHLLRRAAPKDWLAPLGDAGISKVKRGQFADAIIYGPIWAGPYLLPIEQRELDRRDELAALAGHNLILADIRASMELPPASMGLSEFRAQPTIAQMLRRPPLPVAKNGAVGDTSPESTKDVSPTAPKVYAPPVRTRDYWCIVDTKAKRRIRSDGQQVKTMYSCRKCGPCLRWWRLRKRHKYEWAISGQPAQTAVIVSGLADDDVASDAAIAVGRAGDGQRLVSLVRNPLTYYWDALIVFTSALTGKAALNIQRGRQRAGQQCTIETRGFTGAELVADWLPVNGRTPGWHKPCRLVGYDAPGPEPEYQYSDGFVIDAADAPEIPFENIAPIDLEIHQLADRPTDTNANRRAKLRARNRVHIRRWLAGVQLNADALLTLQTARRNGCRGDWEACIPADNYHGPKRLIIDLALALVLDGDGLACVPMDAPDGLRLAASHIGGI